MEEQEDWKKELVRDYPDFIEKPALVKVLFNAKGEPHQIIITLVEK